MYPQNNPNSYIYRNCFSIITTINYINDIELVSA
jgi:hypothetical protein